MTKTLQERIRHDGIRMTATRLGERVGIPGESQWTHTEWRITLKNGFSDQKMTLTYRTGMAIDRPDIEDVLNCILLDACQIENNPKFEDWAGEFGYDTDSRKAEQSFLACMKQTKRLKTFLVERNRFDAYVWKTETL